MNRGVVALAILGTGVGEIVGVGVAFWWALGHCALGPWLRTNPPWSLLTSLAAAPALALVWYWRTIQREEEVEASQRRSAAAEQQAQSAHAEQLATQFSKACELLKGEANSIAAIGAAYSLKAVALGYGQQYGDAVRMALLARVREVILRNREDLNPDDIQPLGPGEQALVTVLLQLGPSTHVAIDLSYLIFHCANFRDLDLSNALLRACQFLRTDLRGVDFNRADLALVDFSNSNLSGADLSNAKNLTSEVLEGAYGDTTTRLPHNLREHLWPKQTPRWWR